MLISAERSFLLVIDMQKKVLDLVHEHARVTANCAWLVGLANRLGVPVLATEHYPKGLGPMLEQLRQLFPAQAIGVKAHFSCVAAGCLEAMPANRRPQVVIAGIETHVCVMQTALDFRQAGKEVFVVADATSARSPADAACALERMRSAGIVVVTREMVLFEWLRQAGTPLFKEISVEFLQRRPGTASQASGPA